MNRNQIIVIVAFVLLGAGIYLFTDIRKPKETKDGTAQAAVPPQQEPLNIEEYIADINSRVEDKTTRELIESLTESKSYKELLVEYRKLDKPLAIAFYSVKLAETENSPEAFVNAGDYNSMLMQTAPDEKTRSFLVANSLECYKKAVDLDSTNNDYRLRLAAAYMETGAQPMQGVTILLDIVRQDSTNVDALMMLGRFGIISGQYDKAIARLEKILYLQPQNSEALLLIAEAYNGQGNIDKAVEMLERCKASVDDPEAKMEIEKYIESIKKPKS